MGKYSRLGKNTILVFIGNIGSKMIGFLMLPFYTSWLSVNDYGITDLVNIYVTFLLGIVTLCLAEAIFIFPKNQDVLKQKEYFSSGFALCLVNFVVIAIFFSLVKYISAEFNIQNTFTKYTWTIYLMLIFTAFQAFLQQFSRSLDKIIVYAVSGIVLTLCTAIFAFILLPRYGLQGYFISQILALGITSLYTFISSKSYNFISLKQISKRANNEMLKYSIPLIPNGVMWWLISALNRPITERYLGLHEVGIFAVANKFPAILMMLFTVFSYSWQISVLEEFAKEGYSKFYNKMVQLVFSLLIFLSCTMAILSPLLITMTDVKFHVAVRYIPILALGVVFNAFSGMVGVNFSAVRKSKYYFYSSVWGAISSVLLSLILIPKLGLSGACLSILISHIIMAIVRLKYSWQYVKLENGYKYIGLILINLILLAVLKYSTSLSLFIYCVIIGVLVIAFILINRNIINDSIVKIRKNEK